VHLLFWLLRLLLHRSSLTRRSLLLYVIFASPQLVLQWQFERIGRPVLNGDGAIKTAGEDLDAKGLTEYLWDVTYWTYLCVVAAGLFGDYGWWLWVVVPAYSAYLAYTTFMGARQGFAGMGQDAAGVPQPASKRQAKMEKRGGKTMYR
jgi:hypothetical protein